jgi:iron-sulfur cluster repair protein YtfE (RIC family)
MTTTTKNPQWPTQLRLPGQTAAADGPVDMALMYVMHHAFRRDLTAFAAAAEATPVTDRTAWRALAERWAIFASALHHHHSIEDEGVWPYLLERVAEEDRQVLEAMEAEHEGIDPLLESCGAGFARLAEHADEDARAALAVRLVAAREDLGRHLRHEETEAIPLIQAHFTAESWKAMEQEHADDRAGLRHTLDLVPWVVHGLPADAREQAFGHVGVALRVIWVLTRRRFARRERVAFRHVTR